MIAHDVRVGEAFTNERKSSGAWRDGLVVMVRNAKFVGDTMEHDVRVVCSRRFRCTSIRIGPRVYKPMWGSYREGEVTAGVRWRSRALGFRVRG
jgi:hypothetical protein